MIVKKTPIATAIMEVTNESLRGRSGLLVTLLTRRDSSPTAPAARLIVMIVPIEYDNRNVNADFHEAIVIAGARLGAPSQDRPWRIPFAKMARDDLGYAGDVDDDGVALLFVLSTPASALFSSASAS